MGASQTLIRGLPKCRIGHCRIRHSTDGRGPRFLEGRLTHSFRSMTSSAPTGGANGMPNAASARVSPTSFNLLIPLTLSGGLVALTAGCSHKVDATSQPEPLEVLVAPVTQKDVPVYKEWIGTLDGLVNADIKAEVSGYLIEQTYKEGSFVRKGQPLFQIDPRPFQAALDQAQGQLSQSQGQVEQARAQLTQAEAQVAVAEANQGRTQLDVDRYTPLAQQQAITQQDLDNATQNNMAARAQVQSATAQVSTAKAQITAAEAAVQSAKAALETARINLGFTRLTAPIDGIPGIAQQQVGALVSAASGPITTVSTLDPIKVYFTVSEQEYIEFARRFPTAEKRQADLRQRPLQLILADGVAYPQAGKFDFADRQVDVRTGAIRVAGLFPNPGNSLRPGQYGRVRAAMSIQQGALLVPQRAVIDLQGTHQLAVVENDQKVSIRPVTLGDTEGAQAIVMGGVRPGERVIVEGIQKVRPGMLVNPKPFQAK
jgi:RND family efflux transporter MFP subunit